MEGHAKSDHEVERVQLQEDIERLQDTLQVHSDDEYVYDSDDDYLLIDLEHSQTHDLNADEAEDVSTRSSFDGKSPYTIQGSVTPVNDVCSTLEHLKELGGADLPVCVESGLALNRAYQEVILNSLHKIQDALAQNRQKQTALEEEMEGGAPSRGPKTTKTLRVFMTPFFKDSSGSCPRSNSDVYTKEKGIKEPRVDPLALIPWHSNHKKNLIKGIKRECLEKALKPLMAKRESLEILLKDGEGGKEKKSVLKDILSIDSKINSVKKLPLSDLIDLVDESTIDWMKIAILDLSGNRSFESCKLMWQNVLHPNINRSPWDKEEEKKLLKLVKTHNFKNWETIAKQLGTNRLPFQCLQHYQINLNKENRGKSSWTKEEDAILREVVEEIKSKGYRLTWERAAIYMEGRSALQCMSRWYQIDPSLNRGAWTEKEDAMLLTAVELMGPSDWAKIQQLVPTRSPGQCRERYWNCLDPRINWGPWQYEEDKKLLLLVDKYGHGKWANVVKELEGRTDNQALQRYNRLLKWKRLTEWFDVLPESTKKAMLGKNLPTREFKRMEKLTWEKFQSQMGVFKEDYQKQRNDQANGEIVVPRPPCVLGYTKSSAAAIKMWRRRVALQTVISLHVKKIRSQHMFNNRDPKELATMIAKMCSDDVQEEVASHVVKSLPGSITVKSLIDVSRKMTQWNKPGVKKKCSAARASERSRVNEALRKVLQTLSTSTAKRARRLGRARKYFYVSEPLSKEQEHKISVGTMSLYCKALGVNEEQILKTAANVANEQKKSQNHSDFEVTNDVSILTSICHGIGEHTEGKADGEDNVRAIDVDVDDGGDCADGDKSTSENKVPSIDVDFDDSGNENKSISEDNVPSVDVGSDDNCGDGNKSASENKDGNDTRVVQRSDGITVATDIVESNQPNTVVENCVEMLTMNRTVETSSTIITSPRTLTLLQHPPVQM
ncbi:snRNA-activating protein complex subunit 4-like [Gigantopelta aegis]|uniref:snRNA-activating protein complex subunit 4-like n=1 Tax=Gigantopelta aegis TaxID=1735272 RepID=UPI001B88C4AC|nr:snRNA-activating protein complex subunit 4-like [Gigantopelta aegis]